MLQRIKLHVPGACPGRVSLREAKVYESHDHANQELAMIIASRTLKLVGVGFDTDVVIDLFSPEPDDGSWTCRYEINWPESPHVSSATGFDAVQALHLALQRIGFDLYRSAHHRAGRLVWEKAGDGYGFPVPRNARFLLIGADKTFEG